MNFKLCALMVAGLAINIVTSSDYKGSAFALSHNEMPEDPLRSQTCFAYYIPRLLNVTSTYENEFLYYENLCNKERALIDASAKRQRFNLDSIANSSCSLWQNCQGKPSILEIVECYITSASTYVNKMRDMKTDAFKNVYELKEKHHDVEVKRYKYQVDISNKYNKNYKEAYESLDACNSGKIRLPTLTTNVVPGTANAYTKSEVGASQESHSSSERVDDHTETFSESRTLENFEVTEVDPNNFNP